MVTRTTNVRNSTANWVSCSCLCKWKKARLATNYVVQQGWCSTKASTCVLHLTQMGRALCCGLVSNSRLHNIIRHCRSTIAMLECQTCWRAQQSTWVAGCSIGHRDFLQPVSRCKGGSKAHHRGGRGWPGAACGTQRLVEVGTRPHVPTTTARVYSSSFSARLTSCYSADLQIAGLQKQNWGERYVVGV